MALTVVNYVTYLFHRNAVHEVMNKIANYNQIDERFRYLCTCVHVRRKSVLPRKEYNI